MFKKNNEVIIVMFRDNPQLGSYLTFTKDHVEKVNKCSFNTADGRKFNMDGGEVKPKSAIYGSAYYNAFSIEECKSIIKNIKECGTYKGYRYSGNIEKFEESLVK